jgi:uroporphyrinogen-III decarboxylase
VEGPCAEAADLRGISRLMTDFSDDPAFVHDLFDLILQNGIHFAAAQIEAVEDIIGVGDAAASQVGSRVYDEFVWLWEKRLVDAIHANGEVFASISAGTRGESLKAWANWVVISWISTIRLT